MSALLLSNLKFWNDLMEHNVCYVVCYIVFYLFEKLFDQIV